MAEGQNSTTGSLPTSIVVSLPTTPAPPPLPPVPAASRPNNSLTNRKPGVLPANLEEMKVLEFFLLCQRDIISIIRMLVQLMFVKVDSLLECSKCSLFSVVQMV